MIRTNVNYNDKLYVRPCEIVRQYSISRTTVWRLLTEMGKIPKYARSVIVLSPIMKLVNREDFQRFIQERNCQYLRD